MPDTATTTTEHVPSEGTNLTPASGFTVTASGSVQELDFLAAFGATDAKIVTKRVIDVPAHRAEAFAHELTFFSGQPSNAKRSLTLPSAELADELRDQMREWARTRDVNAYFPKHSPAHWSRKNADSDPTFVVTETGTDPDDSANTRALAGTITVAGETVNVKWVADNGQDKTFNNGTNVTYRLTRKSEAAPGNGEVTVTAGTPAAPAAQSRGRAIIGQQTSRRNRNGR